jgi:prepilin-type processing-associated H-X9-DG protein
VESTKTTYTLEAIDPSEFSFSDLRQGFATNGAGAHRIESYRIYAGHTGNVGNVLMIDGRVGICFGGLSEWGDTYGDLDAAIDDYLNDEDAWAARN